jgi:hypothetical protein
VAQTGFHLAHHAAFLRSRSDPRPALDRQHERSRDLDVADVDGPRQSQ